MKAIFDENTYTAHCTNVIGYISVDKAMLWSAPSIVSRAVNTIPRGTTVEILEIFGTYFPFYRILFNQKSLWVSAFNVTVSTKIDS